jgi:tRNA(Ile)-lysidine synthetase-like protein
MEYYNNQLYYKIINNYDNTIIYLFDNIIYDNWLNNKKEWFSHNHLNLENTKLNILIYNNTIQQNFNLLIHYDQISRHPIQNTNLNKIKNTKSNINYKFATQMAFKIIHNNQFNTLNSIQKMFVLLTIRHNKSLKLKLFVLNKIYNEFQNHHVNNIWYRFLRATIIDINNLKLELGIHTKRYHEINNFEKSLNYPLERTERNLTKYFNKTKFTNNFTNKIHSWFKSNILDKYNKIAISISGGVDSMVLSYIFNKLCYKYNIDLILLHICYNNRSKCNSEISYLSLWCNNIIKRPIYVRFIDEIKRNKHTKFRQIYEDVTKIIRFTFYKHFNIPVILGHNFDDCVENIFTNLSKNIHNDNLFGMNNISYDSSVTIMRPFLNIDKKSIYQFAHIHNIDYFIDSTPKWSNRGKIRNSLINHIDNFDNKIIPNLYKYINFSNKMYKLWISQFNKWILKPKFQNTIVIQYFIDDFFINYYNENIFWRILLQNINIKGNISNKSILNIINKFKQISQISDFKNREKNIVYINSFSKIEIYYFKYISISFNL